MIKTLLKSLLLLATLGYLVFALIKVSRPTQEMVCTGVEYTFTDSGQISLIDQPMVEQLLAKNEFSPKGEILADVDMGSITERLSASPYIDTVTCYHTASGKLCIRVTPRHPLLHAFAQDGDEFYVSTQGFVMPAGGIAADLPIVTGHVTRKMAGTRLLTLGRLLQDDEYWRDQAQQIVIDEKGWVEIIPRYSGQRILLGEPKDLEEKLARVRLFYEKAMPKVGWNKYRIINAIYKDQVICTK
ncbi:MAG: cell division protein FtsQ/DivIB [Bacteroidaceae bacterium]|nr:cell division protein FtsQ/DivIB [Bacteroidaceae bacterium]